MPLADLLAREHLVPVPAAGEPLPCVDPGLTKAIHLGIVRAARILPFKPACLVRSLAEARMRRLSGLPAELNIGFASGKNGLSGHAWVSSDPKGSSGHAVAARYRHFPAKTL